MAASQFRACFVGLETVRVRERSRNRLGNPEIRLQAPRHRPLGRIHQPPSIADEGARACGFIESVEKAVNVLQASSSLFGAVIHTLKLRTRADEA
jgi:hypothetical protein